MNELVLVLKTDWFLAILKGEKKTEYRDFSDFYIARLLEFDKAGAVIGFKEYDTVRFALGYKKERPEMVVKVEDIYIEYDENDDEDLNINNCNFAIDLGEIVSEKNTELLRKQF